ncbi:3755_t:CDS:2 [Diversispora eburnea]|uniref:3755_t:CDS:1 n=1 Tax=Diversispora eburnea TaxID=1213867 RepID=A0A9N8YSW6_9GLOM|nr:3755_t:CDS:2 [Diversispora eburnea]
MVSPQDSPYLVKTPLTQIVYKLPVTEYPNHKFIGCSDIIDYEIHNKLGEGTFGEVHKGIHKKTNKVVALKRILMHNEKEGIPITAIREIKILKMLSHTNVINLIDMAIGVDESNSNTDANNEAQPSIYMIFPYMDHDLAGLLENPKVKFTEAQIKWYMKQLLEGTFYLHQHKILHRDLKDNKGVLKIGDFGLSRPLQEKSLTGCVVTRWYRAPELLLKERRYDTAIDMWAIGCVFGEMLKGSPILRGRSDQDQLDLIFKLCGTPTEEDWPDLLDKLLVCNPQNRATAFAALDHDYFFTEPLPADPKE